MGVRDLINGTLCGFSVHPKLGVVMGTDWLETLEGSVVVLDGLGNCPVVLTLVGDSGQWVVTMDTNGTY